MKISVVVNTRNEEKNIKRCLNSIRQLADEMVVVDQYSTDKTVAMAKKLGAKVYFHRHTHYVEPARNFALSKATGDWILLLDADEEIPPQLAKTLKKLTSKSPKISFYRLPRKNIIFGKWMKHSRWWPDYNIRFFQKGKVTWSERIHSLPETEGKGQDLPSAENQAIIHYHYDSMAQYLERMGRYTDAQVKDLIVSGYQFFWPDLISKPLNEFLSRFFAAQGYKDGLHGLVLALLQSFSELVVYLKVWEKEKFKKQEIKNYPSVLEKSLNDFLYWQAKAVEGFERIRLKIKRRV